MKPQVKTSAKVVNGKNPTKPQIKVNNVKASSVKSLGIRLDNHNETLLLA